ncbi:fructose-bisphosphate aldolase [Siculibacillus lacustris]|uniref:Fructose-bisphosphate aldolase n=1 Tax=Siculibacillus lacustris TaxID=1549641 RepID=A0A4Q9VWV9_9HYPH|nr:fructose-bisphosphate aldolase [Siculibacillus lacustris]TBW40850.1 fructose-bisphosphate aldolase [Siculibacillus lacustris]
MPQSLGKKIRLSRLLDPKSGRGFCIAFDHALQLGPCPGLETPEATLDQMAEAGVDAVILPLGSARHYGPRLAANRGPGLILRLDQTTMWREGTPLAYPDGHTRLVASVDDAVAAGAEAVITYCFFAPNDPALETAAIRDNAAVNAEARAAGMIHIVETMGARSAKAVDIHDGEFVRFHVRIGIELGADVIKTDWPGSVAALRRIVGESPVPVMLAGGPGSGSDRGTLELVHGIIGAGAAGILFGRSIFQAREPLAVMKACRAIIHAGASVDEAIDGAGFARRPEAA